MSTINDQELFEKYYQTKYDFNTTSLTQDEVDDLKKLVREKRASFGNAPMGTQVFEWIIQENPNIRFELVDIKSENIDGLLYVPVSGEKRAYIVLNSTKPLINQIFTAMHEYYHYVKDYKSIKQSAHICDRSFLKNVNEKCAARFAAEFLLPEEALRNEMKFYRKFFSELGVETLLFPEYATISYWLLCKYQIPLKAILYRLFEEGYINNLHQYIHDYAFIKEFVTTQTIGKEKTNFLYLNDNPYINDQQKIYYQMKKAYQAGWITREEILRDAKVLDLNEQVINDFFQTITDDDDEDDDEEMLKYLNDVIVGGV